MEEYGFYAYMNLTHSRLKKSSWPLFISPNCLCRFCAFVFWRDEAVHYCFSYTFFLINIHLPLCFFWISWRRKKFKVIDLWSSYGVFAWYCTCEFTSFGDDSKLWPNIDNCCKIRWNFLSNQHLHTIFQIVIRSKKFSIIIIYFGKGTTNMHYTLGKE